MYILVQATTVTSYDELLVLDGRINMNTPLHVHHTLNSDIHEKVVLRMVKKYPNIWLMKHKGRPRRDHT